MSEREVFIERERKRTGGRGNCRLWQSSIDFHNVEAVEASVRPRFKADSLLLQTYLVSSQKVSGFVSFVLNFICTAKAGSIQDSL